MTNFEQLKAMSLSEFAEWLAKYGQFDDAPWMAWFDDNYCKKCESIKCVVDENDAHFPGRIIDCAYCELKKNCKYFPALENIPNNKMTIEMWLNEKV